MRPKLQTMKVFNKTVISFQKHVLELSPWHFRRKRYCFVPCLELLNILIAFRFVQLINPKQSTVVWGGKFIVSWSRIMIVL